MYQILASDRPYKERYYLYGDNISDAAIASLPRLGTNSVTEIVHEDNISDDVDEDNIRDADSVYVPRRKLDKVELGEALINHRQSNIQGLDGFDPLMDILRDYSAIPRTAIPSKLQERENNTKVFYLASFVSGRAYPTFNSSSYHPATEKAGGLAIYIPQYSGDRLSRLMNIVTSYIDPQILSACEDGILTFNYKYLKPSRERCSLFVCFEALRIVARILSLEAVQDNDAFRDSVVLIHIFTDSNTAWKILSNSTTLLKWGSSQNENHIVVAKYGRSPNADILFPLSRIYRSLTSQTIFSSFERRNGVRFARDIRIRFRHQSEVGLEFRDSLSLEDWAYEAAQMQYSVMQGLGWNDRIWRKSSARPDLSFY